MALQEQIRAYVPWGPVFGVGHQQVGFRLTGLPARESHENELRAKEAAGADPAVLAKALMDAYHACFPLFRGLGDGFRRRDQLSPQDSLMGLWALVTFRDGWRVLEYLGTSWDGLLNHLLARWPPNMWLDDAELLRIPQELQGVIHPEGLVYGPQTSGLDLEWLPHRLACGLTVMGPIPRVRLPKKLECRGPLHLGRLGGIRALKCTTAPGRCLTVAGCQALERIDLPTDTKTVVRGCNNLFTIAGKLTADLLVEDCPSLERLDIVFPREADPAPKLTVRRCLHLKAIGRASTVARVCGDISLEACEELTYVQPWLVIRGHKTVTSCPNLGPLKGGW